MELRQLRYFIAVADERSFTRAAERLHMSQPPLNRQITQLEDELGVQLLDRHARPLELTPAGAIFHDHAVDILARIAQMESAVRQADGRTRSQLSIGYTAVSLYGAFPEVMRRVRLLGDVCDLSLHKLSDNAQLEALKSGEIDIAFTQIEAPDPLVAAEVLRTEPLVVAVPRGHRLAYVKPPLTLAELAQERVILYPDPPHPSFCDLVLALLRRHEVVCGHTERVGDLETALGLVAAQVGVTLVPEAVRQARTLDVVYQPLREADARCPVVMSRRAGEATPVQRLVMRIVSQVLREQGLQPPAGLEAA